MQTIVDRSLSARRVPAAPGRDLTDADMLTARREASAIVQQYITSPRINGTSPLDVLAWALGYELKESLGHWPHLLATPDAGVFGELFELTLYSTRTKVLEDHDLTTPLRRLDSLTYRGQLMICLDEVAEHDVVDLLTKLSWSYYDSRIRCGEIGTIDVQAAALLVDDGACVPRIGTDVHMRSIIGPHVLGTGIAGVSELGRYGWDCTAYRSASLPPRSAPETAPVPARFPLEPWRRYVRERGDDLIRALFGLYGNMLATVDASLSEAEIRNVAAVRVAVHLLDEFATPDYEGFARSDARRLA